MNQLEERLRAAGRSYADPGADINSIKRRGETIRRNRRIGMTLTSIALVAMGGVAAVNLIRPSSDSTVISASDGEMLDDDGDDVDLDQANSTEPEEVVEDDSAIPSTTVIDRAEDGAGAVEVQPDNTATDDSGTDDAAFSQDPPSPGSLSDGSGGWLTATPAGVQHLRVDGTETVITFADPPGGFAQRWPTDVVFIDGRHYLLVNQFVNREDIQEHRERALAEQYGVAYDPETGATGLDGVAAPEELDALNHWEVSILAVDLAADEIIPVENRVINSTNSPEWVYNGHMTSDGSNIMVMRELWQGHCLYAEGLTLSGEPVEIVDSKIYAKPTGLDIMTVEEIEGVLSLESDPPQPCHTLQELPDSGLGVWGTQADSAQMESFRIAFFEIGLG